MSGRMIWKAYSAETGDKLREYHPDVTVPQLSTPDILCLEICFLSCETKSTFAIAIEKSRSASEHYCRRADHGGPLQRARVICHDLEQFKARNLVIIDAPDLPAEKTIGACIQRSGTARTGRLDHEIQ